MPFYVYILQSEKDLSFYKGFTLDPQKRLTQHNNKETSSTSSKVPWGLVYLEILTDKTTALRRERALKKYSHAQIHQLLSSKRNQLEVFLKEQTKDNC